MEDFKNFLFNINELIKDKSFILDLLLVLAIDFNFELKNKFNIKAKIKTQLNRMIPITEMTNAERI